MSLRTTSRLRAQRVRNVTMRSWRDFVRRQKDSGGCAEVREELGVQLGLPCMASVGAAAPFSTASLQALLLSRFFTVFIAFRDVCKSLTLWRANVKSAD